MGPLALELYRRLDASFPEAKVARRIMQTGAHFSLDMDFWTTCRDVTLAYPIIEFPVHLPAENVFIEVNGLGRNGSTLWMLGPDTTLQGVVAISMFTRDDGVDRMESLGHFRPRTKAVNFTSEKLRTFGDMTAAEVIETPEFLALYNTASTLATVCELLCEPRLVERVQMPRADRKRAARAMGAVGLPTTWARVRWNIGEKSVSKNQQATEGHGRPYHMVRGHWRNYGDRHTKNSERRPGRPGWWTWIDTHHAGNPAFGIVGHRYDPKLHPEKSALVVRDLIASRMVSKSAMPDLFH